MITWALVLIVITVNGGAGVTTIDGYKTIQACEASGEMAKQNGYIKDFICIPVKGERRTF